MGNFGLVSLILFYIEEKGGGGGDDTHRPAVIAPVWVWYMYSSRR